MKNTKHLQKLLSLIVTALVSISLFLFSMDSFAQAPFVSFQIARDITGSGLGGNVCPSIALTHNKSTLSIGPNFQRKKMNCSGAQVNYRYSIAKSYNEKREIYFSGNFTFHTSARMSSCYVDIEKSSRPEATYNYDELRLKVIEGYAGIGFKINPTERFSTGFSTGMGMFNTLNKNYDREMFREKAALVMQFRVVLIYNFKTKD